MNFFKMAALAVLVMTLGGLTYSTKAQAKSYMISGHEVHDYILNDFQYGRLQEITWTNLMT